ncbi:glucose-6-phosphate isomerase [Agrobacterium rhizogenes]|uniref:Glucose-6-phosphate isomerase n=1 Tax=Rhizobium rhizogenes (strain K84 / ATCC BAA-868) TaxID=311403 RepID=G6PI_RHIR8|nr:MULTISPECIES: glucose-6-phosphate isomerase [Rhizobium]B9J8H9.1 RecName: Full=Glucose-6-phosphate isomerase; Short=GPI; AltName: Full=Phosphoglucose isomerase; Short=PGI; AltName: Full=Phosphohexose isomerase; Short=PHI [Rhizobium rhizogenes K84]OCJ21713.1 glucose-6-phosphate isomerase [Agrobacterium sp. B131/95]OCJ26843.1 glucose-6-phosphate isomerase [Agrobacterium sp. B133/95]ACM25366.1 glucose-6-phosphate isomerase protein [Rhizobium rhizogenes K84]EJK82876.1 glucose-6-phosphate isomera
MNALVDQLKSTAAASKATDIRAAFAADPKRFSRFSASFDDLLMDYSKTAVNDEILTLLEKLATEGGVAAKREEMFSGVAINFTEDRAVLHTALRNRSNTPVLVDGKDVMPDVNGVLAAMGKFADGIRSGTLKGATGKAITDVINIGIGGSDLGPVMATLALAPFHDGPRSYFVSNIDGAHIADILKLVSPETTLFIIASKTFTTIETMTNAQTARNFIAKALGEAAVQHHFAAVSTALDKVAAFGIDSARVFGFWDWVGGRYSIWSAIGLPLMIAVGPENFGKFLDGAHAMDNHFRKAPFKENLPMLLGLIGFYHRNVLGYTTRAILPYDQRLSRFPAYLQQLDMESNGKGVTIDGTPVEGNSGPVVWGEPGTNGQHAFYQLIHQGTSIIPAEFMIAANGFEPDLRHQHELLIANCLAQSEALMKGRTFEEAKAQLTSKGMDDKKADFIAPHRVFTGNRPSITFVYDKLTPFALGRLIALYEHRVFVEGVLFRINSFDQWGVELGKELATGLLPVVEGKESAAGHDSSTQGLVAALSKLEK